MACTIVALAALTNCKEQGTSGDAGASALESQVRVAELEVENLKTELEEYHANSGSGGGAAASEVTDMDGLQAELDVLQAEYENLKNDLQEFKTAHPMPR